jgi:hypothetical protein
MHTPFLHTPKCLGLVIVDQEWWLLKMIRTWGGVDMIRVVIAWVMGVTWRMWQSGVRVYNPLIRLGILGLS